MYVALAFLLGSLPVVWLKKLPDHHYELILVPLVLMGMFFFKRKLLKQLLFLFLIVIISFALSTMQCAKTLSWELSKKDEDKSVLVVGKIISLVGQTKSSHRFVLKAQSINSKSIKTNILLNWYKATKTVHAGEKWCLLVKLRRPHEVMNSGSSDKEKWYFLHGIRAKGSVINSQYNMKMSNPKFSFLYFRERINAIIEKILNKSNHYGILPALIIGDQSKLTFQEKAVFRNTGTSHLMAISGLHVGLVASFFFLITRYIFQFYP